MKILDCKTLHLQHHCQEILEEAADLKYKSKFVRQLLAHGDYGKQKNSEFL